MHLRRLLPIAMALFAVRGFAQTPVPPDSISSQSAAQRSTTQALRPAEVAMLRPLATLASAATADAKRMAQLEANRRRAGRLQRGFLREFAPRTIDLAANTASSSQPDALVRRTATGSVVWTGKVTVADAFTLRLGLAGVELPQQTTFFVYAPGGKPVEFGLEMKSSKNEIWCPAVAGDTVVLEVHVPAAAIEHGKRVRFTLRGVIEGFPFESEVRQIRPADFSDCKVDPSCLDDTFWEDLGAGLDVRKAIAYLEFVENEETHICSGGLLNNRPTNFPAYLLTAHHCFSTQDAASSLVAYFDYDTPFCGGVTVPWLYPTTTGSTLLATNEDNDFTFVELSGNVPNDNGRVYLGWSTVDPDPDTALYRLHHPDGGPLSYSATTVEDVPAHSCPNWPESHFIYSTGLFGATIGGSSGSPVFRDGGYVVGQLLGKCAIENADPCDYNDFSTLDGRFSLTYDAIQPWLDPTPANVMATAQSPTSVAVTWDAVPNVSNYKVWRFDGTWTSLGTPSLTSFTDFTAQAGKSYLYCVQTVVNGSSSSCSDQDVATTVMFTNNPLAAGSSTILAAHLSELRTAVNAVRTLAGLSTSSFTGGTSGSVIKASDITDVRTALDGGMSALGLTTGGYTNSLLANTPVLAVQFQEIRNRVK